MKAISSQTLSNSDIAPSKGADASPISSGGKASKPFQALLATAVHQQEGGKKGLSLDKLASLKGEKVLNSKEVKTPSLKNVLGQKGKGISQELEAGGDLTEGKDAKSTSGKEASLFPLLSLKAENGLLPSLDKEKESSALAETTSKGRLMNLGGKDLLVSVEDRRTQGTGKNSPTLSKDKKLASFEKEGKNFSPKLTTQETSPTGTGSSVENRLGSTQFSPASLKRDLADLSPDFWSEWEAKVDAQIVDKARIVLKDGERGEIQLRLYPEKLGSVRIRLDVEGSHVLARFVVDNAQVKEVFEANSASMQQSLEQSGLSVSLDFSTAGEGNGGKDGSPFADGKGNAFFSSKQESDIEVINVALSQEVQSIIDMMI
jgi:flagellar hook-length control protein FliK